MGSAPDSYDYNSFSYDPYYRPAPKITTQKTTTISPKSASDYNLVAKIPATLLINGQVVDCVENELTCYEHLDRKYSTETSFWNRPDADWSYGTPKIEITKVSLLIR